MLGFVSAFGGVGFSGLAPPSSSDFSANIPDFLLAFYRLNSSSQDGLESGLVAVEGLEV